MTTAKTRNFDNKFNLGDEVAFEGKLWHVSGLRMDVGYDLRLWRYCITKAVYGDYGTECWGARCDVDTKMEIPEDKLATALEHQERKLKELKAEEAATKKKLDELRSTIRKAKAQSPGESD